MVHNVCVVLYQKKMVDEQASIADDDTAARTTGVSVVEG